MTEAEHQAIESAIMQARNELDAFSELFEQYYNVDAELTDLYDAAKPVHTSALGIWCTVVDILRARKGLDKREPGIDAINLEELFGANARGAQTSSDLET